VPTFHYGIVLFFCWLTSCSLRQTGYRYADWYLYNRIDHYFDIESSQKPALKIAIASSLNKVSAQLLPAAANLSGELANRIEDGTFAEGDAVWLKAQYNELVTTFYSVLVPEISAFLSQVSEKQIQRFGHILTEDLEDAKDRLNLSEDAFRRKELQILAKRWSPFVGKISTEQEDQLVIILNIHRAAGANRLKVRTHMQETLISFLGSRPNEVLLQSTILQWASDRSLMLTDPEIKKIYLDQQSQFVPMTTRIDSVINPKQRVQFTSSLRDLRDDLMEMSQRRF